MYGLERWLAKQCGFFSKENRMYHLTLKGAFNYHHFESYYTLAYINKMWGIMREETFLTHMKLLVTKNGVAFYVTYHYFQ